MAGALLRTLYVEQQVAVCWIRPVLLAYQCFDLISRNSESTHICKDSIVEEVCHFLCVLDSVYFLYISFQCAKCLVHLSYES